LATAWNGFVEELKGGTSMTFNPKFPSYRMRIATLALMSAIFGGAILFSGHDYCHRGKDALALAGILALAGLIPESPVSRPKVEKYDFTEGSKP
jgi:hypothetical protein